jgi:hypothetical protein
VLAVILAGFQLAALIFTVLISSLKRYLRRRKRLGLMESVAHMQEELTLVGFISLILIAFQQQLTSVCVPASAARGDWALLHHVYDAAGCHCCLAATKDLKSCVAAYNQCGNATAPYCNCGGRDPSCMPAAGAAAGAAAGYGALAGGAAPPYPAPAAAEAAAYAAAHSPLDAGHARRRLSGARRALLAGGGGGAAPALASQCLGPITLYGSCPQGQMPVVSFLALEQVHLLIFTITVVHVVCGVLLYFAGLARIRLQWARWERRDDPHTRSVRLQLDQYYAALATGGSADPSRSAAAAPAAAAAAAAGVVDLERQAAAAEVAAAAVVAALQQEHHNGGGAAAAKSAGQGGAGRGGGARLWAWAAEGAKCLCIGLSPRPVTSEQYYKMKASFVVTHRLGAKFEFLRCARSVLCVVAALQCVGPSGMRQRGRGGWAPVAWALHAAAAAAAAAAATQLPAQLCFFRVRVRVRVCPPPFFSPPSLPAFARLAPRPSTTLSPPTPLPCRTLPHTPTRPLTLTPHPHPPHPLPPTARAASCRAPSRTTSPTWWASPSSSGWSSSPSCWWPAPRGLRWATSWPAPRRCWWW